jgi:hypothetical protein
VLKGNEMTAKAEYKIFIASIDNCPLSACVDDSARTNATDTMIERGRGRKDWQEDEEFWIVALDTAKACLDDWHNYYPELSNEQPA